MLGSWLARQQAGSEKPQQVDVIVDDDGLAASQSSAERTSRPFVSPHDAILNHLHPAPKVPGQLAGADKQPVSLEPNASQSKVGMSPAPSTYTGITANLRYTGNQSNVAQPQAVDLLLDPYDGSTHGALLPQDTSTEASDPLRLVTDSSGSSGEAMWSHLSKVLELQGQIAKMHIEMEGIGSGDGKRGKGMMGRGGNSMDDTRPFHGHSRLRARAMSNISNLGSSDEKGIDEEGVGVEDEETEQNKAREEEFAKLADQFEGKKESIRGIMNKVRINVFDKELLAYTLYH
jgi:hypothetical protein